MNIYTDRKPYTHNPEARTRTQLWPTLSDHLGVEQSSETWKTAGVSYKFKLTVRPLSLSLSRSLALSFIRASIQLGYDLATDMTTHQPFYVYDPVVWKISLPNRFKIEY